MDKIEIQLENGKYTYIMEGGKQTILRNGLDWRDETGDNLLLAIAVEIEQLKEELDIAVECIEQSGVGYDEATEHLR